MRLLPLDTVSARTVTKVKLAVISLICDWTEKLTDVSLAAATPFAG